MPPITAMLHTANHGLRLGRTLEMLLPCSEILIVDHGSVDCTRRVAGEYGARVVNADGPEDAGWFVKLARHEWVFCIEPGESINESLQASLYEWALQDRAAGGVGSVRVREQKSGDGWVELPVPQTRLVPRTWIRWSSWLPAGEASAVELEGRLLRFGLP